MAMCKACHAEIKFIRTENGRQMPVDIKPITVITELGKTIRAYTPHWASCPGAETIQNKGIDARIRQLSPEKGMTREDQPQVRITLMRGFEMFGAYETWDDGYIIELFRDGAVCFTKRSKFLEGAIQVAEKYREGERR